MAKRRSKARRASAAEKTKARNLIAKAYKEIGAKVRGRKERVSQRMRAAMTKVVKSELLSKEGEPLTRAEAKALAGRMSLLGVAKKTTARARTYYTDKRGRFRDARPGHRGAFISAAKAKTRDKVAAYWSSIQMIASAQGVTIAEARRAYKLTGPEPWERINEGRTPPL